MVRLALTTAVFDNNGAKPIIIFDTRNKDARILYTYTLYI